MKRQLAQLGRLQEDLRKAEEAARENVEAAVILTTMQTKGIINIGDGFNVTLNHTGELINQA